MKSVPISESSAPASTFIMAKKEKARPVAEEPVTDAETTESPNKAGMKDIKTKKPKKDKSKAPKAGSEDYAQSTEDPSAPRPKSKKRKAPDDDAPESDAPASPQAPGPAPKKQKPKQKKNPKQSDEQDALFDLDQGINTVFARMDPDLLADYVAAATKRFATDLSPIELSDLHVPPGAVRDTTSFAGARVKERLPDFLESCVAGESEIEQKRLGSAPKEKGAPHTIVVTSAGLRAADLVRVAKKFQKKDNLVAKLVR